MKWWLLLRPFNFALPCCAERLCRPVSVRDTAALQTGFGSRQSGDMPLAPRKDAQLRGMVLEQLPDALQAPSNTLVRSRVDCRGLGGASKQTE